ncbi:Heterokaryon incompatibility protein 6,OR allele [Lachnellula subtilissima]|uniref:Heterokaryon incompatibility protein 6,OR allele n=1 Tax=Lachnellula subtilissima TaxID=602034 RepID=A0A8H8RKU8_9HELO|nr:Heterokaryon incompatibility protein 6,OR allele [Lachnellula subtilissima]
MDIRKPKIRLVHLQPLRITGGIECELTLANLYEKPMYEALSYEWGPLCPDDFRIKLGGQEHFVRENLWAALRCLRSEEGVRTLWMDAICVDQSNIPERNHQVSQMGRVYSQASAVIAWIGTENYQDTIKSENNVHLAQDFLHELNANRNLKLSRRQIAKYEKNMRSDDLGLKIYALMALCYRSCWTRLWVDQEVLLSQRGMVQCGSFTFNLDTFRRLFSAGLVWREFYRWADDTAATKMWTSPCMRLFELNKRNQLYNNQHQTYMTMIQLMLRTSYTECGDARDKIFRLLNISAQCCRAAIPPDYSRSFEEIRQSVLEHHHSQHSIGNYDMGSRDLFKAVAEYL